MRIAAASLVVAAGLLVVSCSTVTEKDLANLESPNAVVKNEVIRRICRERSHLSFVEALVNRTNEKRAVAILMEALRRGRETKDTKVAILKALGELGKHSEVRASVLIESLKEEDPSIRSEAIVALAKTRDRAAPQALVTLLEKGTDMYTVIWALGEIGDQEAVPYLNRLLGSEDNYVRYNAYRALARIETPQAVEGDSNRSGLLDIGRSVFKKYQDAMTIVFQKIASRKTSYGKNERDRQLSTVPVQLTQMG